jgi:hypothetical protein
MWTHPLKMVGLGDLISTIGKVNLPSLMLVRTTASKATLYRWKNQRIPRTMLLRRVCRIVMKSAYFKAYGLPTFLSCCKHNSRYIIE